jgi:6-phosphogluconolactonase (cycloisomerase 2 family)
MSRRFWLLGVVGLISVALLVACGSKYNSSSNGLVLVGSQGSNVIQTFSFNLNSGHSASLGNSPGTEFQPTSIVMDVTGAYAYVILGSVPAQLAVYKVDSGGTLTQAGSPLVFNPTAQADVVPSMLARDAAGKFLFSANRSTTDTLGNPAPGSISVFAIGGGTLTEVPGSPFSTPATLSPVDIISVAASPTVFPGTGINGTQNSVCSAGTNPPTSEYLYAVDHVGAQLFQFQVDTSSGGLTAPPNTTAVPAFTTDAQPEGVAVDPCDRFVYVSGSLHNKINAYTICTVVIQGVCSFGNGALVEIAGSPISAAGSANGLGPIIVDPYGNDVYVVGTLSNTVSGFKISPITGSLTALNPATVQTGSQPKAITIRADNNWMFVSNYGSASVSQYSITPATGALSVLPTLQTDNSPWGVAVK